MLFKKISSPYISTDNAVHTMMYKVLLALIPGTLAAAWFFGWGILINIIIASLSCLAAEAFILLLRRRPVLTSLQDGSALITACLLALALPPLAPWWLTIIASGFAIIMAKHLYGGLGFNPFNPAMVGYIVVLISFPREMTFWTIPLAGELPELSETLYIIFTGMTPFGENLDALTTATPIDTLKTQLKLENFIEATRNHPQYSALFGSISGKGWEWINACFLAGGIWLVRQKVVDWRIPTAFLLSLIFIANVFAVFDYATYSSPLFHAMSGGTMLAAFFIASDPVTASTTPKGRWIYGAGIGMIAYTIRTWGGYPDGIAFAVVLMNITVPLIDHYTQPRTYGKQLS